MNARRSKFIGPVRSMADIKTIREMRDALNSLLNARVVSGNLNQVHYSDGNVVYEVAESEVSESFYPFKIYQPDKSALTKSLTSGPISAVIFDTNGNQSVCTIDPTKPTNLPLTINPGTDFWRIWSVRDGCVEIRPYYNFIWYDRDISNLPFQDSYGSILNNYSVLHDVGNNTDGIYPYDLPSSSNTSTFIILNGELPTEVNGFWLFWIEITPDTETTYPYATIKCIQGTQAPAWNPLIVPVGVVGIYYQNSSQNTVYQFLFDHCLNRWAENFFPNPSGLPPSDQTTIYSTLFSGALSWRGSWTEADGVTPTPIQNQLFYPGDAITVINPMATNNLYEQNIFGFVDDPSLGNQVI